jgi:hypothetical protein
LLVALALVPNQETKNHQSSQSQRLAAPTRRCDVDGGGGLDPRPPNPQQGRKENLPPPDPTLAEKRKKERSSWWIWTWGWTDGASGPNPPPPPHHHYWSGGVRKQEGGPGSWTAKGAETATAGDDQTTNQPILHLPRLDHRLEQADLSAAEMGSCSEGAGRAVLVVGEEMGRDCLRGGMAAHGHGYSSGQNSGGVRHGYNRGWGPPASELIITGVDVILCSAQQ